MMGKEFTNLTEEDLCDLMCGGPEEEPCDDVVSREAVHDLIAHLLSDYLHDEDRLKIENLDIQVEDLPSVTPKQKAGYWRHYEGMLYCSKCGAEFYDEIMEHCGDDVPKYCPDCGQPKMFEPQGRSEKK